MPASPNDYTHFDPINYCYNLVGIPKAYLEPQETQLNAHQAGTES
jgi:hypothetical protein